MKGFNVGKLRFVKEEMTTNLGEGNFIFVGSSTDGWADIVPVDWIIDTLGHCRKYDNRYLFQSKNPTRFNEFLEWFPAHSILGTTIETNRDYKVSQSPPLLERAEALARLDLPRMASIEPIMDFDLAILLRWIAEFQPEFVSIGADSKGHNLPEPSEAKTHTLIENLRGITKVYIKGNLKRLLSQEMPI